jgi:hypothetical protein
MVVTPDCRDEATHFALFPEIGGFPCVRTEDESFNFSAYGSLQPF